MNPATHADACPGCHALLPYESNPRSSLDHLQRCYVIHADLALACHRATVRALSYLPAGAA